MGIQRVAKTSVGVLNHTFEVGETLTDATGTPTVAVTDATGAAVSSGNATHTTPGTYQFSLAGQSQLGWLTAAWSATIATAAVVQSDQVEIVGGFFFSLAQARGSDASLADTSRYQTADLERKRLEVEEECELICDRTFVPRYARVTTNGTGLPDLVLPHPDPERTVAHVRTIRSVKVAPRADETFVAFSSTELAALQVGSDGTLRRLDGRQFAEGFGNVVIEYELGLDGPPPDLVQACLTRLRSRLNLNKSAVPDRASSFTTVDGGTFRLSMPGAYLTGIPDVDAVYARYSRRSTGTGPSARKVPASRPLNYDPQRASLFHGGRR